MDVILSAAKDPGGSQTAQILRCAQNDRTRNTSVNDRV